MKVLKNPAKPQGSNIIGFVFDKTRVDVLEGDKSEPLPCHVAEAAARQYPWLVIEECIKDVPDEKELVGLGNAKEIGGTPLDGFPGLGEKSIEKLHKAEIMTREMFMEKMSTDPVLMKKLLNPLVFAKLAEQMGLSVE